MKPLFYLGNKSHTTQRFTHILQNRCSKSIKKFVRKALDQLAAYEKLS